MPLAENGPGIESIFFIVVFLLIIAGNAIKKLFQYLAEQARSGQEEGSEYRASGDSVRKFLERLESGAEEAASGTQQRRRSTTRPEAGAPKRKAARVRRSSRGARTASTRTERQPALPAPEPPVPSAEEASSEPSWTPSVGQEQARETEVKPEGRRRKKHTEGKEEEARRKPPVRTVLERLRSPVSGKRSLKQAVVWYEVLGSPVALRKRPGHRPHVMQGLSEPLHREKE